MKIVSEKKEKVVLVKSILAYMLKLKTQSLQLFSKII